MRLLFTRNRFHSQEFSRISRANCSIYSTRAQRVTRHSFMRTHDVGKLQRRIDHSQLSAPPVWYSITRVSKKFLSFNRSSTQKRDEGYSEYGSSGVS